MNNINAILFDLDGTITDSAQGIMNCYNYAFEQMGFEKQSDEVLRSFVGPPVLFNMASVVGADNADEAFKHYIYRTIDLKACITENRVYSGMVNALRLLNDSGKELFICTSKGRPVSCDILNHYDLIDYFKSVYGANSDGSGAEKTDIIGRALTENELDPSTTVMIGDRSHDIEGAKAHKMRSIGVGWGYGSEEELRDAGADVFVKTPEELIVLIKKE